MEGFEVVVVGGGLAGLAAALAARRSGAGVLLISKSPVGKANCTAVAAGNLTAGVNGMSVEEHLDLTRRTGHFLNEEYLVTLFSQGAPRALEWLQENGVPLESRFGGASTAPFARNTLGGMVITRSLIKAALGEGVTFWSPAMVKKMDRKDGSLHLEVLDLQENRPYQLVAGAVVLATGGCGKLYRRTDNPPGITGDGLYLAARMGLPTSHMEFTQFYPLGFAEPGFRCWYVNLGVADYAPLTDQEGGDLLASKLTEWGMNSAAEAHRFARDRATTWFAGRMAAGRQILWHTEQVSSGLWSSHTLLKNYRSCFPPHRSPQDGPVVLAPIQHYTIGGIPIDSQGATGVEGLYACGEVATGWDGAGRVGGNALVAAAVFGCRAGTGAAETARRQGRKGEVFPLAYQTVPEVDPGQVTCLRRQLGQLADAYLGPIRSPEDLEKLLQQMQKIKELVDTLPPVDRQTVELKSMLLAAEMMARTALLRPYSIGTHQVLNGSPPPEPRTKTCSRLEGEEVKAWLEPVG